MPSAQKPNIYQRMNSVMKEISGVAKDKEAKFAGGFKYASHDAVVKAVRDALVTHGIVMVMDLKSHVVDGNRLEAVYTVRFVNVDNPEDAIHSDWFGFGIDSSDKGPGKAISYIKKYALLNTLSLPTGDDPENDNEAHSQKGNPRTTRSPGKAKLPRPKGDGQLAGSGPKETFVDVKIDAIGNSPQFDGVTVVSCTGPNGSSVELMTQDSAMRESAEAILAGSKVAQVRFEKTEAGN